MIDDNNTNIQYVCVYIYILYSDIGTRALRRMAELWGESIGETIGPASQFFCRDSIIKDGALKHSTMGTECMFVLISIDES